MNEQFRFRRPTGKGDWSPWGSIHRMDAKGEQILEITTASHGGYWLNDEAWAMVKREFPGFRAFAGEPWLEEDMDVTVAILLWPQLHKPETVWQIVRACQKVTLGADDAWAGAFVAGKRWLDAGSQLAQAVVFSANVWERANGDRWIQGGGATQGPNWISEWKQVGTGDRRLVSTAHIPTKHIVTTEELDAMSPLRFPKAAAA